ncbi:MULTISPECIES: hypothetical protein [Myroides]|uniref:Uncharacterized protein n=1 Tax=Myroides albus TaxID=2562892 RepID=A0A6I3LMD1_9FLAO|nr:MULTISPECIES: hypothetical protein [Myroides]MTG97741.1 hypothetical protein [Myroides albus]MVX34911.1 hypothetical protein [Myroides sp. LoEW2-1]UVD78710.1 hypothetical protein NWE55_11350 [Myroides albus]
MNTRINILIVLLAVIVSACKQEENSKANFPNDTSGVLSKEVDSQEEEIKHNDMRVVDLPIVMGEANYLMFPVGEVRVYGSSSKFGSKSNNNSYSYTVSNFSPYELTGFLDNIMFQHKDSLEVRPLTDKKLKIHSATYLKSIADKYKKHFLLYKVFDEQVVINPKTPAKLLYISEANGRKFKNVIQPNNELLDWTVIDAQHRLYFRTIEDINKDGILDIEDTVNYYYINLLDPNLEIKTHDPLEVALPVAMEEEEK